MNSTELTNTFTVGDAVVYPSQGVGYIESTETRKEREYLRIRLNTSSMDVLLPAKEAGNLGLRHLTSEEDTNEALDSLSIEIKDIPSDWKVRLSENQALLKNGDLLSVACVVNSLYRRSKLKELPSLERKVYESALDMLVDESSSVLGINSEEMRKTIFAKLEA